MGPKSPHSCMLEVIYKIYPQFRELPEEKVIQWYKTYHAQDTINNKKYFALHTSSLVPTLMIVDIDLFHNEIEKYRNQFSRWGINHVNFPRYGIPLTNLTGSLEEENDPSRMPLDEHFMYHQDDRIIHDNDVNVHTEVCNLSSLDPLNPIKPYLIRSSILRWDTMGHFKPHIDVGLPAPNLRLWGTTNPSMCLKIDGKMIKDIEPGRLYIIDTSKIHEGWATDDNVYQFFIGCSIESYDTLISLSK